MPGKVCRPIFVEVKAAREAVKLREGEILNYFVEHSTNASAETFDSKIKGFRAVSSR